MAWVAVNKNGSEQISHSKPIRLDGWWVDKDTYNEVRRWTTDAKDYSIELPEGSSEKLLGRKLTWSDEPVELKEK